MSHHFASDNYSPVLPAVMDALAGANDAHVPSYGDDPWTARLTDAVRAEFGADAEVFPVLTGSGANVVALSALLPRWGAVVCADSAHIHTDENGAAERIAGTKLLPAPTADGKLRPADLDAALAAWRPVHGARPLVVSVTQSTEVGTLYSVAETAALTAAAHDRGLRVHMDGARLFGAAAALGAPLRDLVPGVDVLTLGGTKTGALGAEAVVVLNPDVAEGLAEIRKLSLQLASKQRYLSAQLLALLADGTGLHAADAANRAAARLAAAVRDLPGVDLAQDVQVNSLFVRLPRAVAEELRQTWRFYDWRPSAPDEDRVEVRWVCSWDTTEADVDAFASRLAALLDR